MGATGQAGRGRLLRTLAVAGALMAAAAAGAQPVVGRIYEGSLPTERGYDVPLPEARWRVTHVADRPNTGFTLRVVVLRNQVPKAQLPYLFVRYALQDGSWTSPCDRDAASAFDVDRHWTLPNQILNKCSRKFVTSLPGAASTGWWEGLGQGIEPADAALQQTPLLMSEIGLMLHRGAWVRVEAFMRTDLAGLSPTALRDAARAGTSHPWNFATQIWGARYMTALENAVVKKRPATMEAFEQPTPDAIEDRIRQMSADARQDKPPAPPPAAIDDREVVDRIRQMAEARPAAVGRTPPAVTSVATAMAAAALAAPAPAPAPAAQTSPPAAAVTAAPAAGLNRPGPVPSQPAAPGVSQDDFAKLAAEIARLRDELKARPQATPMAVAPAPAAPVVAAPPPSQARRLALVIGNDGYQSVARLQNARTDARAMADLLGRTGYKVRLRLDLTERAMKDELRAFKAEVQGGDEVLFFFAGHGVQLAGANYLLPTDIRGEAEDQVRDDALLLQKVLDDLQERKARFALAIVDACRDNPFRTAGRTLGGRGLAPTTAATGQMVMFSAGAGQQALDRLGERDKDPNGLFTRILLKEMDKRELSVDRVLRTVRNQVVELAKSVGHEQVPALYDQSVGEFYFRR